MKALPIFFLWLATLFGKPRLFIECKGDGAGMYSNLMRIAEWIYCVEGDENYNLYLNMSGAYGSRTNPFTYFFKPFEDPQIFTEMPADGWVLYQAIRYPKEYSDLRRHPTDGMTHFSASKWVYAVPSLYEDPDFSLFRKRLHPIIEKYLKPSDLLQERIDAISAKMNHSSTYKIGIHIRCTQHFKQFNRSDEEFLADIERDIDEIMKGKDPLTTQIFLATLVEPVVDRLSKKYNVIVCDIPRTPDLWSDWDSLPHTDNVDAGCDVIVDGWSLAGCDEVWGGVSNLMVFIGCLNPELKIHLLPSLQRYDVY